MKKRSLVLVAVIFLILTSLGVGWADNQAINGDFESGTTGLLINAPKGGYIASTSLTAYTGKKSLKIYNPKAGSGWQTQVGFGKITIVEGDSYQLSLAVFTTADHTICWGVQHNGGTYDNLGLYDCDVAKANQWTILTSVFNGSADDNNGKLFLDFGAEAGTYWLDSVQLTYFEEVLGDTFTLQITNHKATSLTVNISNQTNKLVTSKTILAGQTASLPLPAEQEYLILPTTTTLPFFDDVVGEKGEVIPIGFN
jgi:hypothetical protein